MLDLHDLLADYEAARDERRAADHSGVLTASALGALCNKALTYSLHHTEPSDDPDPVTVATVGTLLHLGVAQLWEDRGLRTEVSGEHGTADTLDDDAVRDLKTLSRSKFDRWLHNGGPPSGVWSQVACYAVDHFDDGRADTDKVTLVVDALCRDDCRTATYVNRVDLAWCREQIDRLRAKQDLLADQDPDDMVPERDAPDDWLCKSCPWRWRCWTPYQDPDPDSGLTPAQMADVADLLRERYEAAQAEAESKALKRRIDTRLARIANGAYGDWTLRWVEFEKREHYVPPTSVRYPVVTPTPKE